MKCSGKVAVKACLFPRAWPRRGWERSGYFHPGGLSVNNPAMVNDRGPLLDSPTAGCPVSAWNLLQVSSHRGATKKFRELQRRNDLACGPAIVLKTRGVPAAT
jgi:hypothetical protein